MSSIEVKSANLDQIVVGKLGAKWSARGDRILRYYIDFRHKALNIHREVSAPELFILQGKVDALMASWDEKSASLRFKKSLQSGVETASDLEREENEKRRKFQNLLNHTLGVDDRVDWESLKDRTNFKKDKFQDPQPRINLPDQPAYLPPNITFFEKIFGKSQSILNRADAEYRSLIKTWEGECAALKVAHAQRMASWETKKERFRR